MSAADKVATEERLRATLQSHRRAGRRVVFTNGAFDVLHVGHVRALEEAASLGGVLVVAVNGDASVRAAKGPGRPAIPAAERAEVVAALACVDHVVIFEDETVDRLLEALRPDVHAKGRDYTPATLPESDTDRRLGIEIAIVGDEKRHSTTDILWRAAAPPHALDHVVRLSPPDGRGFALRRVRPTLEQMGWLDLARLVDGEEGVVVQRGRSRSVRRVEVGGRALYVKINRPLDRNRSPIVEFQNHLALRAAGFRAPEPWLCLEGRTGDRLAGVLVTLEAPGLALDEHLALSWPAASPRERHAWARGVGSAIRALHTARFLHPDLQAWHLLVDGSLASAPRALVFLDLMRLARAGKHVRRRHAVQGLAALTLSLEGIVEPRWLLAGLRAYLGGSLRAARPWLEAIAARTVRLRGRGTFRRRAGMRDANAP